jgi:hypothetical protein
MKLYHKLFNKSLLKLKEIRQKMKKVLYGEYYVVNLVDKFILLSIIIKNDFFNNKYLYYLFFLSKYFLYFN